MKLIFQRLIRFFTGVILPVPLFVMIFFFSDLYKEYHGYSFEDKTYATDAMSLSNSRMLAWEDMFAFLFFGYIYMLIPSIVYSISLEIYRAKFSNYIGYVILGSAIGGLSSLLFIWINPGYSITNVPDAFIAFSLSVFVGAAVAMLLSLIGHPKLKKRAL